jgi:hypothetical protein
MIVTPYGGPPTVSYYGLLAPLTEPSGGTVYFDDISRGDALNDLLQALGIYSGAANYAAFAASSADPNNERYLDQIRFVSGSALKAR